MENKWTVAQENAIFSGGKNLLVSAAAGSGKTAVLVERIVQKILDSENHVDIDNLLVVTFTEAAAAQMKERIAIRLHQELESGHQNANIHRQISKLASSDIKTIDAFCLSVVKNNFHLLGIDPNFTIGDAQETEILKQNVLSDVLETCYSEGNTDFLIFAQNYSTEKSDAALEEIVLDLTNFLSSMPFSNLWMKKSIEMYDFSGNFEKNIWVNSIKDKLKNETEKYISNYNIALCDMDGIDEFSGYYKIFAQELEGFKKLHNSATLPWNEIGDSIFEFAPRLPASKGDEILRGNLQQMRKDAKITINLFKDIFSVTQKEIIDYSVDIKKSISGLFYLVQKFLDELNTQKKEKGLFEFSDIEKFCLEILTNIDEHNIITPSEIALGLGEQYTEILIDEYQDTNPLQEAIFTSMESFSNRFYVGDMKQSIYRFRQSDPTILKAKKDKYPHFDIGMDAIKNRKIILTSNFRSREIVIMGINSIFDYIMSEKIGDVDYNSEERLNPMGNFGKNSHEENISTNCEVILFDKQAELKEETQQDDIGENDMLEAEELTSMEYEAAMIAKKIKQMLNDNFMLFDNDNKIYRKATYKDFVVLMRATKKEGKPMADIMSAMGIPTYSAGEGRYFLKREIQVMLALLEIIDNPRQDIPLLAVMRSVIFGFSDNHLLEIKMFYENDHKPNFSCENPKNIIDDERCSTPYCFYDGLDYYVNSDSEVATLQLKNKIENFISKLDTWRDMAQYTQTSALIWHIYQQTGFYAASLAMAGGSIAIANLNMLFEKACQFEKNGFRGIYNFISYIRNIREINENSEEAKIISESHDVVRIMSIHKSKGLEFGVVFVAGIGRKFNKMDMRKKAVFHKDYGIGLDFIDTEHNISLQSISKRSIKGQLEAETLSEEMRILYVALTRAKEKLILVSCNKNIEKQWQRWEDIQCQTVNGRKVFCAHEVSSAKCYADWVMPAIIKASGITFTQLGEFNENSWNVKLYSKDEISLFDDTALVAIQSYADIETMDYTKIIEDRFAYTYPYASEKGIETKLSVSELKRIYNIEEGKNMFDKISVNPMPQFLEKSKNVSSAKRGTFVHYIMEHIDIHNTAKENIQEFLIYLVEKGIFSLEQTQTINIDWITGFFSSPLGIRIKEAKEFHRETTFEIPISASTISKNVNSHIGILLQGVIDCYFIDKNDRLVLLDYKTDKVVSTDEVISSYKIQIDLYQRALEKITGRKVDEKIIYLFSIGKYIIL